MYRLEHLPCIFFHFQQNRLVPHFRGILSRGHPLSPVFLKLTVSCLTLKPFLLYSITSISPLVAVLDTLRNLNLCIKMKKINV